MRYDNRNRAVKGQRRAIGEVHIQGRTGAGSIRRLVGVDIRNE